ncbi:hypothetical protein BDN70DRAFT_910669 [Pholiota conissans]|uniref:DUF7082 domain-containing protein n=1 Tax=Pholiota conissans TaxID=109636 RepID=A0A9P6D6A9_9AGAR|nr:hypothetical protein BDN70DRAFT_910669 [Pholiota conissans]
MASSDSPPIVSPTGIIHVLGYTPTEGERGVPITVRIHFHPDLADAMYVRLVVGNKAVPTKVRQLPAVSYGRWQLYAAAPPFDRAQFPSTKVLISVQALNEDNDILDTVTFGEFSYWASGHHERRASTASSSSDAAASAAKLSRLQVSDVTSLRRRPNPPPDADRSPFSKSPPQRKTRLHRRMKAQSLMRTKQQHAAAAAQEDLYAQTPVLELVTPLTSICSGWTSAEVAVGRRLVRFTKIQDGRRLIVSCEPIPQDEFCEADSVISCIYREESDSCYVTSVDVIYLLERLTNGEFPVEEKNRIRRNLEGLRPTTVSKHKSGFGDFFQRIMEFPDPKPRNIEKDLKVFDWNLLGQALEKILSKYSIYTSTADAEDSPPPTSSAEAASSAASTESPELYAIQLSYPSPDEAINSRFLDQQKGITIPKYEPFADEFPLPLGTAGDLDPAFASPVDSVITATSSSATSSSCAAFPMFASDGTHTTGAEQHNNPWGAPFKVEMPLDNYNILSSYEVDGNGSGAGAAVGGGGGIHTFGDNPALDFDLYDNYTFAGIADDALANLADQYI